MIIAVSVQIWKFTARINFGAFRQENTPQSAPNHIRGTLPPSVKTALHIQKDCKTITLETFNSMNI